MQRSPFLEVVPPAADNLYDEAVYLASSYGLTPDDWQSLVLWAWLGQSDNRRWAASRCGLSVPRQNGKNGALEIRELYGMVLLGERFLHTAHEVKTARKAFLRLASFFENLAYPELAGLVKEVRRTNGQEAIILTNGGSCEFVARSRGSGRGFTVDVLVLDEAQELTEEQYAALSPTISAAPLGNPQRIMLGTPPGPTLTGEVFGRLRNSAQAIAPERVCWIEYAASDPTALDDIRQWQEANPALGIRLSLDTVADERSDFSDDTFLLERLGVWPVAGSTVIDMDRWSALVESDRSVRPSPVAFAAEVSPDRKWSSILLAGRRNAGGRYITVVESQRGTSWLAPRMAELAKEWKPVGVAVRHGSPAMSLLSQLTEAGVETTTLSATSMGAATGAFLDWVGRGEITHDALPLIDTSLRFARQRKVGEQVTFAAADGVDISPLQGAIAALHLLDEQASKPKKKVRSGLVQAIN